MNKRLPFSNYDNRSKIFLNVGLEKISETFILNYFDSDFFNVKRYFFCLFESNINRTHIPTYWDFVFPIVTLTESFFLFRNYKQSFAKSLFIKFGAWFC